MWTQPNRNDPIYSHYATPMSTQADPWLHLHYSHVLSNKPRDPIYSQYATPVLHSQTVWPHLQSTSYTHIFKAKSCDPIYSP